MKRSSEGEIPPIKRSAAEDWQTAHSSAVRVSHSSRDRLLEKPDLSEIIGFVRSVFVEGDTLLDGFYGSPSGQIHRFVGGQAYDSHQPTAYHPMLPLFPMETLPSGTTSIYCAVNILLSDCPKELVRFILGGRRDHLCSYVCEMGSVWGLVAGILLEQYEYRGGKLHFPSFQVDEYRMLVQEVRERRERDFTGVAVPPLKAAEYATDKMDQKAAHAAFFGGTGTSSLRNRIAPLRNLTGSPGVRPIRVRLLEYLVVESRVVRAALAQRAA